MTATDGLSRRSFLISAAAIGGGMALGFALPLGAGPARAADGAPEINAWIVIRPDDTVVIRVAHSEMGQGSFTALPMLVAEELECDWRKVVPERAPPAENLRRNRVWGDMSTNASRAITGSQEHLRRAGATAREMLIAAAAARWNVAASECRAAGSRITHLPSGRVATFGEVAEAAAGVAPPQRVRLKDPKDWKLIGTPQKRFEVTDKITGAPIYGIDVRLPNMLYAAIRQCPVFQGTLRAVDDAAIAGMKGVRHVVRLPDAVAVVAESWWQAKRALAALPVTWDEGEFGTVSSDMLRESLRQGLATPNPGIGRQDGDVTAGLARAAKLIEAEYTVPFLAHATLEPQNCTAQVTRDVTRHVTGDRVEVWAPTQDGETALATAADAAGVPHGNVIVHTTMLGGGFGRRGTIQDFVRQAVLIAKGIDAPVKLVWTREEDTGHDFYRPMAMARLTAGLDAAGMPTAWKIRIAGQSILASVIPEMSAGTDRNFLQALLEDMPYEIPNYLVDLAMVSTHVPVGVWRSVNHSQNAFFKESFVDEMAHAGGHDPYLFRRRLLARKPRHLAVLDAAARQAGWDTAPPRDVFRGIALNEACDSICAHVVEVSLRGRGALRVDRVVVALDCGFVVNPQSVEHQIQGGVVFALTAALYGEITVKDGRVEQSNFHDYPMLRMADMPLVETVLVPSGEIWGGVGEPPVPPLAPALCNAIFAATGRRVRSLPLKEHDLRRAREAAP
jgi:isoquinoline 1-oxidoreductase subunit beta